ncbi:MAG: ATP-binding cassette domain-containing protein, partial [Tannerellaceae bacterium]|nr:ATP-binding cassette domain-containing protein [Tannerellaceae bacterium]
MLEMKSITKAFPGVKALDNVSLKVEKGEILGLIGINGAGKSTLMNILGGIFSQDEGSIYIGGNEVKYTTPKEAEAHGISFIHQEPIYFYSMTVAQNIYLSRLFKG